MKEQVIEINHQDFVLHGIVAIPDTPDPSLPIVLIPNSGLVHHVGTCRSSVAISRALADAGFLSCRLDLSNLGDSSGRFDQTQVSADQRTVQELKAVIDYTEAEFGARPVIVYGLCSGSQNGFKLAVSDERVIGLIGVDHFSFKNWSFYLYHYLPRLFAIKPWRNRLQRFFGSKSANSQAEQGEVVDLGAGDFIWQYPPKAEVEAGYKALLDRQVAMEFIYTGDWHGEYNHRRQFFLMHSKLDFKGLVVVQYMPAISHILAEPDAQDYVKARVVSFARRLAS